MQTPGSDALGSRVLSFLNQATTSRLVKLVGSFWKRVSATGNLLNFGMLCSDVKTNYFMKTGASQGICTAESLPCSVVVFC